MTMWLTKLFLCIAILELSLGEEEVSLDISQGTLKGIKTITVYHGMPMYSFKGIPYAKSNMGPNKFRAPEPLENWNGVWDATKHRDICTFFCMIRQGIFGSDDCLFLNVYTPDLNKDAKRPVMVFIHPGGFNGGSGDDDLFGADFLIEQDVILVTMNFRLGAVGFLNTGDANAPGNVGMKDQVMALKWVQENIMNFGGCPKRVTIFGHSSGAASVQYHMLSPMSQNLFSGAIMQSGSVGASWAISYTPREDAMLLSEKLGIKSSSTADMVEQLAQIPTRDLVMASSEISKTLNFLNGEMNLFRPSVETDFGQDIFLPADPWELIKSGKIADVPLMVGLAVEDSGLFTPMVLSMASNFEDHFDMFIPIDLNVTDPAQRKMMGDSLKEFYFHGKPVNMDTSTELTQLLTDVFFGYGTLLTTKIMNSRINSPVYEYLFTFYAPFGFMKTLMNVEGKEAVHGDELGYLFYSKFHDNKPVLGSAEEQKIKEMVELWTNFAKERNPSTNMNAVKVTWEPMDTSDNYLEIGNEFAIKKSMFKERVDLWTGFFKSILGDYAHLFN